MQWLLDVTDEVEQVAQVAWLVWAEVLLPRVEMDKLIALTTSNDAGTKPFVEVPSRLKGRSM